MSSRTASAKKILAVDNEPSVTFSLQYVFPKPRYDLTCVDSGDAALKRLEGGFGDFDVVIVDQKMPNLTGVELVEMMRNRGIKNNVVVLSAHVTSAIRETYERMGVCAIFDKPFDVEEIRTAIDQIA